MCSAETTRTPSGTISSACWAAEPCQTPSIRVALPLTAAASGTVASISSWPGRERVSQVRERLGLVAEGHAQDHDRGGSRRVVVVVRRERRRPGLARGHARRFRRRGRTRASRSRSAPPTRASRIARPKPSAPDAPITATGSVGACGTAAEYRLRRDEARGKDRARHRRRVGYRRRDGPPPGGRRARAWRSATSTRRAPGRWRGELDGFALRARRDRHGARCAPRSRGGRRARRHRRARQQRRHGHVLVLRQHRTRSSGTSCSA